MIDVDIGSCVKPLRSLFVDDLDNLPGVQWSCLGDAGENLLLSLQPVLDVELDFLHGIRHDRTMAGINHAGSQLQDLLQRPEVRFLDFDIRSLSDATLSMIL